MDFINGNYLQYVAEDGRGVKSNLYTHGNEFTKSNGIIYVGYYHIHSQLGPMVGKVHTDKAHETLIPIGAKAKRINKLTDYILSDETSDWYKSTAEKAKAKGRTVSEQAVYEATWVVNQKSNGY